MNQFAPTAAFPALPALITAAGNKTRTRFLEFFAANIRSPHTRRAYGRAVADFMGWCDDAGVLSLAAVQMANHASTRTTPAGARNSASMSWRG